MPIFARHVSKSLQSYGPRLGRDRRTEPHRVPRDAGHIEHLRRLYAKAPRSINVHTGLPRLWLTGWCASLTVALSPVLPRLALQIGETVPDLLSTQLPSNPKASMRLLNSISTAACFSEGSLPASPVAVFRIPASFSVSILMALAKSLSRSQ